MLGAPFSCSVVPKGSHLLIVGFPALILVSVKISPFF